MSVRARSKVAGINTARGQKENTDIHKQATAVIVAVTVVVAVIKAVTVTVAAVVIKAVTMVTVALRQAATTPAAASFASIDHPLD